MWWVQLSRWAKDQVKLSLGRLGIASPSVYLALLTSWFLSPFYCRAVDGIKLFWRTLCESLEEVREAFFNPELSRGDGPVSRLRQIGTMVGFQGMITKLLSTPMFELWTVAT